MKIIPIKLPHKLASIPCFVDDEDYEMLNTFHWHHERGPHHTTSYAVRSRPAVKMHRLIMNAPKGMVVNHINGNGLDNQKSNLEVCTQAINAQQRTNLNRRNQSGCSGVSFDKAHQKWKVQVNLNGKQFYLGIYADKTEAIEARRKFSIENHIPFLCQLPK